MVQVWGARFRVWGEGFRDRVSVLRFRFGIGLSVWGFGFWVRSAGTDSKR